MKLTDVISSFIDPDPGGSRTTPILPASKRNPEDEKDSEETEFGDPGPDPEEAKARFRKLESTLAVLVAASGKRGLEFTDRGSDPRGARRPAPGAQADPQAAGPPDPTTARHDPTHPHQ